ncbi:helix-turn-helix domain-containing protein [Aureimonas flava]|uniref:helix-turn-helix domain-containing protein n=1 Tax=Aureimonas flava TaxID=2320271 RepID=UPI00145A0236|nr:helix-turn-helix transcriptional regulator [Aureimonas flava]
MHIGNRLRAVRERRGMTLGGVGRNLGLTYQQIRKYESGENRLSASRLYNLSLLFQVEPGYFFAGLGPGDGECAPEASGAQTLSAALSRIDNPEVRHHLKGLIEVLDVGFAEAPAPRNRPGSTS